MLSPSLGVKSMPRAGAREGVVAVARQDLLTRQTFPRAPVMLGQPRIGHRMRIAEERSGLARAQLRTGEGARALEPGGRP